MLYPRFLVVMMSHRRASAVGAVYTPSGQNPYVYLKGTVVWKRNMKGSELRLSATSLPSK
jgi:hypothetical protein